MRQYLAACVMLLRIIYEYVFVLTAKKGSEPKDKEKYGFFIFEKSAKSASAVTGMNACHDARIAEF